MGESYFRQDKLIAGNIYPKISMDLINLLVTYHGIGCCWSTRKTISQAVWVQEKLLMQETAMI